MTETKLSPYLVETGMQSSFPSLWFHLFSPARHSWIKDGRDGKWKESSYLADNVVRQLQRIIIWRICQVVRGNSFFQDCFFKGNIWEYLTALHFTRTKHVFSREKYCFLSSCLVTHFMQIICPYLIDFSGEQLKRFKTDSTLTVSTTWKLLLSFFSPNNFCG